MEIIKVRGKYYKELNLDELEKEDLLDIIKNSKEVQTSVFEGNKPIIITIPYTPYAPKIGDYNPLNTPYKYGELTLQQTAQSTL